MTAGRPRRRVRHCRVAALLLPAALAAAAEAPERDPDTGLVVGPGWEDVRANCGGCHSYSVVTNARANRAAWLDMIRWMQRTQNLWDIPAPAETRILDYLASNYAPGAARQRRPALRQELMPIAGAPRR